MLYSGEPVIPPDMDTVGKRVCWALDQRGLKATNLAKSLGITRGAVSQWRTGIASPDPSRLTEIADYIGCDLNWLTTGTGTPFPNPPQLTPRRGSPVGKNLASVSGTRHTGIVWVVGQVAAGVWADIQDLTDMSFERRPSLFAPVANIPAESQYDLVVMGDSINRFAADGSLVRCIALDHYDLQSGDYVHVQRFRHQRGEVENTIKRAFLVMGRWQLRYDSTSPRWQAEPPLALGSGPDEQVEIVGVAVAAYSVAPTRR